MHFRSFSVGFFLFGTGGIINYFSTSITSSLLLGLLFYALSIIFFFKYREFEKNNPEEVEKYLEERRSRKKKSKKKKSKKKNLS